jgi:hypothetical protein
MASPAAAGVAALLLGAAPGLSPSALLARLKATGKPIMDLANGMTTCRVDAARVLINDGGPTCVPGAAPCGTPDSDCDGIVNASDNCPPASNAGQTNGDSGPPPPAGNTGGWSNGPTVEGDDTTVANGDALRDDCDLDKDNDGRLDYREAAGASGDCGAAITTDISAHNDYGGVTAPTGDGPSWDTDGDVVPDGVECRLGTHPASFSPAHRAACFAAAGPGDSDGDGIHDSWEMCKWMTRPSGTSSTDSDNDGINDCIEVADVNGNGVANAADATIVLRAATLIDVGDLAAEDINANGLVNAADRSLVLRLVDHIDPSLC